MLTHSEIVWIILGILMAIFVYAIDNVLASYKKRVNDLEEDIEYWTDVCNEQEVTLSKLQNEIDQTG